ncbi:hypothetical protein GCM10027051_02940 [Niabella terrae]
MENFEKIEAYTAGWLSETARQDFEAELLRDPALRQDYEDWLAADKTLRRQLSDPEGVRRLEQLLRPLQQQYFTASTKQARLIPWKKYLTIAIAAAVLLLVWLMVPGGPGSYQLPEMPAALVRGNVNTINQAAQYFNQGAYSKALPLLKTALAADPGDATSAYFLGLCYFKTEDFERALPLLEQIATGKSVYQSDACFFTALAAYKMDLVAKARIFAGRVPESGRYYKNAKKLLQSTR